MISLESSIFPRTQLQLEGLENQNPADNGIVIELQTGSPRAVLKDSTNTVSRESLESEMKKSHSIYFAGLYQEFISKSSAAPKVSGEVDDKWKVLTKEWQAQAIAEKTTLFVTDGELFKGRRVIVTPEGHLLAVATKQPDVKNKKKGHYKVFTKAQDLYTGKVYGSASMRLKNSEGEDLTEMANQELANLLRVKDVEGICRCWLAIAYTTKKNVRKMRLIVEYGDLGDLLSASRALKFTKTDLRSIVYQLLTVVKRIDSLGLIHRDIKPENIVLMTGSEAETKEKATERFLLKMIDLGAMCEELDLEKRAEDGPTSWYFSPKLAKASRTSEAIAATTHKLDVWQVGVCIFELYSTIIQQKVTYLPWFKTKEEDTFSILSAYTIKLLQFDEIEKYDSVVATIAQQMLRRFDVKRPSAAELLETFEALIEKDSV